MTFISAKIIGDNVNYETYHQQDAKRGDKDYSMSRSELVTFAECPRRWLDGYGVEDDSTTSTEWGSLIDCLLTSPERFDEHFAVAPETYPDAKTGEFKPFTLASKWCKEWKSKQSGKTIVKAALRDQAELAVNAISEQPEIAELFKVSRKQVLVIGFWKDRETDLEIPVRILLDLVPPADHAEFGKWLADFKTARNGDPAQWPRVIDDSSYDVQAALYRDLYVAATGEDRTDFVHIVQENVFPFHVVNPLPAMSTEFLDWGRVKYQKALRLYCRCLATGVWPSYEPAGLNFRGTQIISPDGLWSYRQSAGDSRLATVATSQPQPESCDLIP